MGRIGVGIIGASVSNPGWATAVHVPAIQGSDHYELRAVSTSAEASAAAASKKYGVPGYSNPDALIGDPNVDLVVVAVKVTHHHALISKVLAARKAVFSEWPLGVDLAEAEALTRQATALDAHTIIGLQARYSPAIQRAKELVNAGALGEILATSLVGSGMAWLDTTDSAHAYMFEAGSGASTVSVPLMHALDALTFVLGEFDKVDAASAIGRKTITLTDRGSSIANTSPDHVAVSGLLQNGAVVSTLFRGGSSRAGNLRWEINGTKGDLLVTATNGNIQVADLELRLGRDTDASVDDVQIEAGAGAFAGNVARLYDVIAHDIKNGTRLAPGFQHALKTHRLLSAIEMSSTRASVNSWW